MESGNLKRAMGKGFFLLFCCYAIAVHADTSTVGKNKPAAANHDEEVPQYSEKLSHRTHTHFLKKIKGAKNDCTDCHRLDPSQKHYELERSICKKCHTRRPPPPAHPPEEARKLDGVVFEHKKHEQTAEKRNRPCEDCHQKIAEDKHKKGRLLVEPDRCLSCHKKEKVKVSVKRCGRCHEEQKKTRTAPQSHGKAWNFHHGSEARWDPVLGHGRQCALCHANSACVACHRTQRPRNHTGLWRLRMHGKEARWAREGCKTCHETGACISCHRRTKPMNHRGAWKKFHGRTASSESDSGCATCHNPGWCAHCHRGAGR